MTTFSFSKYSGTKYLDWKTLYTFENCKAAEIPPQDCKVFAVAPSTPDMTKYTTHNGKLIINTNDSSSTDVDATLYMRCMGTDSQQFKVKLSGKYIVHADGKACSDATDLGTGHLADC